MGDTSQLIPHIEAYVDSSRSPTQQAAILDAIVFRLKQDAVTIGSLEMEMYLTTTDDILCARERIAKHAGAIWSLLKDAIYSSGEEPVQSFNSESLDDPDYQKYEIATEALALLEKLIVQNNDMLQSVIIGDEEINMIFNTINSYNEISLESKQKLHMVGRILYVCAKESVSSFNKVLENFFPRLVEALEVLVENISRACHSNDNCLNANQPNYGSLYLCIKLLGACRGLAASYENLISECISANKTWSCSLQRFSISLTKIFSLILATWTDGPAYDIDTYLGGQEAVIENAYIIIKCLIELVAYPHVMLVRETAIQCLVAMSELPCTRIYPVRIQVLKAISRALDDSKRAVHQEAVKC